jgi:hypothetical protein
MTNTTATRQARSQRSMAALALLSLGAVGMTAIVARSRRAVFVKYEGDLDPLLVITVVSIVGAICLIALEADAWFRILSPDTTLRSVCRAATPALLFALAIVGADLVLRFPEDTNVAPPHALLFYPAMAYVAEVVFHALPLAVLLVGLRPLRDRLPRERLALLGVVTTALLEPTFQLHFEEAPLSWAGGFVWLHVFAFNLAQLRVLRRHDFVSMYTFRIVYYLCWHVVWGVLRLRVLFR